VYGVLGDQPQARQHLLDSLALNQERRDPVGSARTLNQLGLLALAEEDYAEARRCFQQSLVLCRERAMPVTLEALAGMAQLLVKRDERARALDLIAYIQNHPASDRETQVQIERLRAELEVQLPADVTAGTQPVRPTRSLADVVAEIAQGTGT
jgi:tetratricopeptide (TPR) repeat protein